MRADSNAKLENMVSGAVLPRVGGLPMIQTDAIELI
jgi:hypothetical protein